MLKTFLALLGGLLAAFAIVFMVERIGHSIWPPPADVDWRDRESARVAIAAMPAGALMMVALGWVSAAFGGGWVAARYSGHRWGAWFVAAIITAASVATLLAVPHPPWLWGVAVVLVPLAGVLAGRLGMRARTAALVS